MVSARRKTNLIGVGGLLMVVLVTPLAGIYAVDYKLVETRVPPGGEVHAVSYDSLDAEERALVDSALAGDGSWYRTPGEVPFDRVPLVVARDGRLHAVGLDDQFHWASWRGKLPLVTALAGLVAIAVTFRRTLRGYAAPHRQ